MTLLLLGVLLETRQLFYLAICNLLTFLVWVSSLSRS